MSSGITLDIVAAGSLWLIVVYRMPLARRAGSSRALWCALLALAIGSTLKIVPVNVAVEHYLQTPGAAVALRHVAGLASAVGVLIELAHLTGAQRSLGRRALILAVPTLLAMTVPFAVAPPGPGHPALAGQAEWYDTTWVSVVHWLIYLTYLGWSLLAGAVLCWRSSRHAAPGPLRTGITLIGAGMGLGLSYVALKAWMTVAWAAGNGPGLLELDLAAESLILAVVLLLICAGCAWQPAAGHLATARESVRTAVALWRLYPLWVVLRDAAPRVVLRPERPVRRYAIGRPARLARLLVDRIIEIRDGLIELRAYAGPEVRADALTAAHGAGVDDDAAQAVAEAVTLEVGRRAKAAGARTHQIDTAVVGDAALPADTAWLIQVARAHASPLAPQLADLLTRRTGDQNPAVDHAPVA